MQSQALKTSLISVSSMNMVRMLIMQGALFAVFQVYFAVKLNFSLGIIGTVICFRMLAYVFGNYAAGQLSEV